MPRRSSKKNDFTPSKAVVTIEKLGGGGDGIADINGLLTYISGVLPGETWRVETTGHQRAQPLELVTESPERVEAPCQYFGRCGGCKLQMASDHLYRDFKRQKVANAFAAQKIDFALPEPIILGPHRRRRLDLTALNTHAKLVLGFYAAQSATIIDVEECLVAHPRLVACLPPLRQLLRKLLPTGQKIGIKLALYGEWVDLLVEAELDLDLQKHEAIAVAAEQLNLARFSHLTQGRPYVLIQRHQPQLDYGVVAIVPPPGCFLQASAEAEQVIREKISTALTSAKNIADLFGGFGALSLEMVRVGRSVEVFEADPLTYEALSKAPKGHQVVATKRDLFKKPLNLKELNKFDGVIFDPPHAGAAAQCEILAQSNIPTIAAVSCNPATLARDLRILLGGGYQIQSLEIIDQFHWSAEVEVLTILKKM